MIRLRALYASAASLLVCIAVLLLAASALAHGAKPRVRSVHGRRSAPNCTSAHAKHTARCRVSRRRVLLHGARTPRPAASLKQKSSVPLTETAPTQAVTIAKVLATPCQNTNLIPEPANLALARAAVLCLVNTERAQNGEDPLKANAQLEEAAESHGREMLALDYFNHVSPSGLTPVGRIRPTGYIPNSEDGYVIGENLAWGTLTLATPQAIVSAWIASPEHLANILESKYVDTGIDVEPEVPASLAEGAPGGLYTQEFGVIVQ